MRNIMGHSKQTVLAALTKHLRNDPRDISFFFSFGVFFILYPESNRWRYWAVTFLRQAFITHACTLVHTLTFMSGKYLKSKHPHHGVGHGQTGSLICVWAVKLKWLCDRNVRNIQKITALTECYPNSTQLPTDKKGKEWTLKMKTVFFLPFFFSSCSSFKQAGISVRLESKLSQLQWVHRSHHLSIMHVTACFSGLNVHFVKGRKKQGVKSTV